MKIFLGADIVPTESNINEFSLSQSEELIDGKLENVLKEADFRIFNLELPLAEKASPIKKCGANLMAPTSCVKGIKKLGVDLLTLANNHIMDQDVQGLESTMMVLAENGIDYVGAGSSLSEAQKPCIIEKDGIKVGIYACAEHEFSIAKENHPGANPFDPLESPDHIEKLKKECNYVIVLYHGGKEHFRYPSPNLQKICRKMCNKGADLVICQHSHCIGCEEKYNNSTIVYGQGNFIFDAPENQLWETSLLVCVELNEKNYVSYIPLDKAGKGVKISENSNILKEFKERSEQIKKEGFIEEKYSEFAKSMFQGYLKTICGTSFLFKVVNKLCGHKLRKKITPARRRAFRNYIECEAHRELLLRALKGEP